MVCTQFLDRFTWTDSGITKQSPPFSPLSLQVYSNGSPPTLVSQSLFEGSLYLNQQGTVTIREHNSRCQEPIQILWSSEPGLVTVSSMHSSCVLNIIFWGFPEIRAINPDGCIPKTCVRYEGPCPGLIRSQVMLYSTCRTHGNISLGLQHTAFQPLSNGFSSPKSRPVVLLDAWFFPPMWIIGPVYQMRRTRTRNMYKSKTLYISEQSTCILQGLA